MLKALKNLPNKGIALVLIVVVLAALYWQSQQEPAFVKPSADTDETVLRYPGVEPAMLAAFIKAQATLSDFLALAESPPEGSKDFAVKVQLQEGGITEYLWVYPFEERNGSFTGRLNEAPQQLTIKEGEEINFARRDIVDWTFDNRATKTMEGNFTGCVALAREAPEHAQQFQELYGLNCER